MPEKFTAKDLERAIGALRLLKYNPLNDPEASAALMEQLAAMCPDREALEWLVNRVLTLFGEWPGPREIRATLCGKYKPADDIEVYSDVYAAGIPSEFAPVEDRLALPPGQASADRELAALVAGLAERKQLPAGCCNALTGRKADDSFCGCKVGQLGRQLAEYQAATEAA